MSIVKDVVRRLTSEVIELVFQNECECKVDYELLAEAIKRRCKEKSKKLKQVYRITMHNSYPTICIAHNHVYVHNLIGELKYGFIPEGYVIHHSDFDKQNNDVENLMLLSNVDHAILHGEQRRGVDLRSNDGKWRGINAAREKRFRRDVSKEKVLFMRSIGMSFEEIAKILHCGANTARRRVAN